ncbi:MAG: 4-hydroxy-tetrahydrodipicolinate reductase [PVC group bacterium]|nr:4-hydroxy-tetrahydrodipicolinate reductase [PVC group bacterium]
MTSIAITGACGKMGKRIRDLANADADVQVSALLEQAGHPEINLKIDEVLLSSDASVIDNAEVVIDFTAPVSTVALLETALQYKKGVVIGTTGLSPEQIQVIQDASSQIPIVFAPNMSVGVNFLFRLVKEAAAKLKDYEIAITEAHHVHKKDAPSGTAKLLAQIIEAEADKKVDDIKAIREGEIIGDHEVRFESDLDTIVLSHSAKTRDIFAKGAIDAAKWLANRAPGLYSMQDVLGK